MDALPKLVDYLRNPPSTNELPMQWGKLGPPVGTSRLKIVELILALLRCVAEDADAEAKDAGTEAITAKLIFMLGTVAYDDVIRFLHAVDGGG